jgi:hypothetical protein
MCRRSSAEPLENGVSIELLTVIFSVLGFTTSLASMDQRTPSPTMVGPALQTYKAIHRDAGWPPLSDSPWFMMQAHAV